MRPDCQTDSRQTDWKSIYRDAVTDLEELTKILHLERDQISGTRNAEQLFSLRVPQPYLQRIKPGDPTDPLLLQVLPADQEFDHAPGFSVDPLNEHDSAVPGLIHKYRSRVLLTVSPACAIHCRYCFRRHFPYQDNNPGRPGRQRLLDYLAADPKINEVILSGGDPLSADDDYLAQLVAELESIPHLTRLRIHTRLPVVIPQRITSGLLTLLQSSRLQAVMVLHVNHPNEIDSHLKAVLKQASERGLTLLNQAVLLRDVNDNASVLASLSEELFAAGVLPYYLHLLDPVLGTAHFEVSEVEARALYRELSSLLAGFLVPKMVREIAGQPSKTLV